LSIEKTGCATGWTLMGSLSKKQEERIAKEFGGSRVPGSGAFWHRKGDVRTKHFLMELKRTDAASYRITKNVWRKIRREALQEGKTPIMVLEIQDTTLVVLGKEDFLGLIDTIAQSQGHLGEGSVS
jgi:hypothetical protein